MVYSESGFFVSGRMTFRNRQTTLRMDRHETIVAERCETFRYYCIVGVLG